MIITKQLAKVKIDRVWHEDYARIDINKYTTFFFKTTVPLSIPSCKEKVAQEVYKNSMVRSSEFLR